MTDALEACPHCRRQAHQLLATPRILFENDDDEQEAYFLSDEVDYFAPVGATVSPSYWRLENEQRVMWEPYIEQAPWQAALCAACKRMSLLREGKLIYPQRVDDAAEPHSDMPAKAAALYREAAAVLPGSRRAAAALARAALESLLTEVDLKPELRRDLNTRVGELRGRINDGLWKVLTALRVVGNDALHSDDDELIAVYLKDEDGELAETFFGAINELVEELITRPKRSDELYALIPDTKRVAAERAGNKTE